MKFSVIGSGAFGTSIATLLLNNDHDVSLWCHESEVASQINKDKVNQSFLPDVKLSGNVSASCDLLDAFSNQWVFIAVPVKYLRSILEKAKPHVKEDTRWVILSKGIENTTHYLPGEIIDDVLGYKATKFALGGPNFAKELALSLPSGVTLACDELDGKELQSFLCNSYFYPVLSSDITGVQVCSAMKNVLALTVGIIRGAGFKDNTRAMIFTLGVDEISTMVEALGGERSTMNSFAGIGDLFLTCAGNASRNLRVGKMIGEGMSLDDIEKETGIIAEGVNTVVSAYEIITRHNLSLPVCSGTYKIMFEGLSVQDFIDSLTS